MLVLLAVAFAWLRLSADRTLELRDEGYLLTRAARAAGGELPHRDFEDVYGPGVCLATGAVLRAFGPEILPVRLFLAALKAAAVAATYVVARALVPWPFALAAAAAALVYWGRPAWNLNTPYAALYTMCLSLIALALWLRARDSARAQLAAGFVAGTSVLFKQSLGAMLAGGLLLAAFALALLELPAQRRGSRRLLALWALAGLVPVATVLPYLGVASYALHFLPLHASMAAVALAVSRRGGTGTVAEVAGRLLPLACGIAAPPLLAGAFYAVAGGLGNLLEGMFVLPQQLQNYASAATPPPGGVAACGAAALALVGGSLLALAGRRVSALGLLTASLLLGIVGFRLLAPDPDAVALLLWSDAAFGEVQTALVGALAVAVAWPLLAAPRGAPSGEVRALLPVLFFHGLLCFQIFPRAGWNAWLVLGATTPAMAWLAWRGYALASGHRGGVWRRVLAAALVALVPAWLVLPVAALTLRDPWALPTRLVELPHAAGLRLPANTAQEKEIPALRRLVRHLKAEVAPAAPVFLLGNDLMILFLAERRDLAPDLQLRLFLLGWGMLEGGIDDRQLAARLEAAPDVVVIDRSGDESAARIRAGLPVLASRIDALFEESARFGSFRVLQRRAGPR